MIIYLITLILLGLMSNFTLFFLLLSHFFLLCRILNQKLFKHRHNMYLVLLAHLFRLQSDQMQPKLLLHSFEADTSIIVHLEYVEFFAMILQIQFIVFDKVDVWALALDQLEQYYSILHDIQQLILIGSYWKNRPKLFISMEYFI